MARVSRWRYVGKKVDPFYQGRPWKLVRVHVLQRDHYQCQVCKKAWANTVHHIIPREERPDLALEESNLQAICALCHNQQHPEKGMRMAEEKPGVPQDIRIIKV